MVMYGGLLVAGPEAVELVLMKKVATVVVLIPVMEEAEEMDLGEDPLDHVPLLPRMTEWPTTSRMYFKSRLQD